PRRTSASTGANTTACETSSSRRTRRANCRKPREEMKRCTTGLCGCVCEGFENGVQHPPCRTMNISIPKLSLVVLIGPSGSGKSTFARQHFLPTEILSSDACRALVSDEENNKTVTND